MEPKTENKTKVPFKDGLFEVGASGGSLIGSRCRQCGQILFPRRDTCLNCRGDDTENIGLAPKGKLYSYTIVYMPSEHFPSPYAVGWIEMEQGLRVFSQLRGWQDTALKTNMDMDLSIETLWEEEDREMIGYVFRPSEGGKEA